MAANGTPLGTRIASGPGDHFLQWTLPPRTTGDLEIAMEIAPECEESYRPALRIVGVI
jgi:hypothetical protein